MIKQLCLTDVVLESVKEIFDTMIFMTVEALEVESIEKSGEMILGAITFKGNLEGCLSVSCSLEGAKTVAANMLCMDSPDEVGDDDLTDAIGEVCNMIMGSIKTRLQESIPNIELSIPSVISGCSMRTSLGEGATKSIVNVQLGNAYPSELSLICRTSAS